MVNIFLLFFPNVRYYIIKLARRPVHLAYKYLGCGFGSSNCMQFTRVPGQILQFCEHYIIRIKKKSLRRRLPAKDLHPRESKEKTNLFLFRCSLKLKRPNYRYAYELKKVQLYPVPTYKFALHDLLCQGKRVPSKPNLFGHKNY